MACCDTGDGLLMAGLDRGFMEGGEATETRTTTVRGQNFSSDALFTPGMDIFKQRTLNTVYIKTLESFPLARE